MAILIPDESSLVFKDYKKFYAFKNAAGYHPGYVAPPTAVPASLKKFNPVVCYNVGVAITKLDNTEIRLTEKLLM